MCDLGKLPLPHRLFRMEITVPHGVGRGLSEMLFITVPVSVKSPPKEPLPGWRYLEEPEDGDLGAIWGRANSPPPWAAAMVEPTRAG